MRRDAVLAAVTTCVLLTAAPALADIVHLRSGGRVEGAVSAGPDGYSVRTVGGACHIDAAQVARVEENDSIVERYEAAAVTVAQKDAEGHFRLAMLCKGGGWHSKMMEELDTVVAIDPDHPRARAALGQEKHGDRWLTRDEIMAERGYAKHNGKYVRSEYLQRMDAWRKRVARLKHIERGLNRAAGLMRSGNPEVAEKAFLDFIKLGRAAGLQDAEKSAYRIQAYYDAMRTARAARIRRQQVTAQIEAESVDLVKMHEVETSSGVVAGDGGRQARNVIQLPEIQRTSIQTTVVVPSTQVEYFRPKPKPVRVTLEYPPPPAPDAVEPQEDPR